MAGGKGTTTITDLLNKIFKNVTLPWDANTNLYVSLHTAALSAGSNQLTSEAAYTNYARVPFARGSTPGWSVSGTQATNNGTISFPTCGTTGATVTYVGIGTSASGAGQLLYWGPLASSLVVSTGVLPVFSSNTLVITEA